MEFPVSLALAQAVQSPPTGRDWYAEPKVDGHRMALWRLTDTVRLQSRAGREVTAVWFDLAVAGMRLPPGVVVDGEACVWVDGRVSFSAAQSRGASTPARARTLAAEHPATLAAFDLLQHPVHGDVRALTYLERRALLVELLEPVGPPLQVVPSTRDRDVAADWYTLLQEQGIEGLVWKRGSSLYTGNRRIWRKQRHADTSDGIVVGFTGPQTRPHAVAVRLDDGTVALSQRLPGVLAAELGAHLTGQTARAGGRARGGETYREVEDGPTVEMLAGSGRHGVITVTRLR
ncbi:hypothetical protein [Streptomyces sp. MBT27]|uniref:ATP-dependent DNA ligase n=1 Tax=Streptomyces sp. MBT27 TaxID=1488356 RepID=UPI001F07EF26|nr:hypothetical protein [Streptomyces sp. MBT27]